MSEKLKPCPFCGGKPYFDRYEIFCDCGAKIEIETYVSGDKSVGDLPTYKEARENMIKAWNKRVE